MLHTHQRRRRRPTNEESTEVYIVGKHARARQSASMSVCVRER